MSHNTFGHLFRVTTWGESHGKALGCVIDGCPPNIPLTEDDIQGFLDKRKPGQSKFVTQRQEADLVEILSGVFEDDDTNGQVTTGTPISLMIRNTDQRSKDYGDIAKAWRPGHGDYTYDQKYGFRDYRGGGRTSARETAARVAAGAVARKVLGNGIEIIGYLTQIGPHKINRDNFSLEEINNNPFFSPDAEIVPVWEEYLDGIRKNGSSIGAVVEVIAKGVPAGWGAPIYGKIDSELAMAMMSINAVKGVEIGAGFGAAELEGPQNADEMYLDSDGNVAFRSNNNGGVLAGLSTGQDIVVRMAIKPTSSLLTPVKSLNRKLEEIDIITKGRHDPCVGIRAVPVAEAMMACVLADAKLRHRGQIG
ncbi:chorismate synthase [Pseudaquidulcibacter saccharophilus]|uniref:chorismate synthase n=1 Tax=Pseudaquidulcibacter saccharophilus TaxID=2831900 RepID=UPI001EFEF73A|nr:chorismate synthase [Pseudaquidulcibacter saccharophilus]